MIDTRPVIYVNGILLLILALAMAVPAFADFLAYDPDWHVFAASAMVAGFVGAGAALVAMPEDRRVSLKPRQAFLLMGTAWLSVPAFAALPFVFSRVGLSFTDGYFEAMAGLTTTASTVISGLDRAPHGILLWRALLNLLGGMGVIIMVVVILPQLRIGGMQLFQVESSNKSEKIRARRTSRVAGAIVTAYALLTMLCAIMLWLAGMTPFEALCHAMSTLSSGGFSTSDASIAHWNSAAVEWVLIVFMILGGATFLLLAQPRSSSGWALLHDTQTRWYLRFLGFFSLLLTLWQWGSSDMEAGEALRHATFTVVSIVTTTGFSSTDYGQWGGFPQVVLFILTFIGGCTGSTAGGVKIFRWQVLFGMAEIHIKRQLYPHGVFVMEYNGQRISDAVADSVLGFVVFYFLVFALFALGLTATGLDFITALSGSAQALGNVGRGLGDVIGPAGSFHPLPDAAKWLLSIEMMLGRLELFTVIVLFSRSFWRE